MFCSIISFTNEPVMERYVIKKSVDSTAGQKRIVKYFTSNLGFCDCLLS